MEKIWLKSYEEGVPAEIELDDYPSIVEFLEESVAKHFKRPAFENFGKQMTYAELDRSSQEYAGYLQNHLNLKKGDRIAIMMPNLLQYPIAMFGALRAGLVVVNVNPLYTPREIVHQMNDAQCETIIVLANFAHVVQEALTQTNIKNIIITELADCLPVPKRCLMNFAVRHVKRMVPEYSLPQAIKFRDTLKLGAKSPYRRVDLSHDDIAFLQYTGGTTGVSKGAVLTHRNMLANAKQVVTWIKPLIGDQPQVMVTPLPLYHIFSLLANLLVFMRVGSMNLLITNPRDIGGFVKTLKNSNFTGMTGVNTLFNALMHHKHFKDIDFTDVKLCLGGGMAVQQVVAEKWMEITGKPLTEGYGLTEASPVVCATPMHIKEFTGSIGLPLPSTDVKVIDDEGNELPLGESGELCVKGPQVMKEYWNMPEETAKVICEDGWLKTGDVAKIDEKGFVYIVDRKKDMIVVSGFNVYPNEVEDVLAHHPGIKEVAVIGVDDARTTEAVKAFIVKNDPMLDERAVRDYIKECLTAYKRPKRIEFVDDLPKSNVGKILRRELREMEQKKS
jgi:long-chain acyl-CoA synthetase